MSDHRSPGCTHACDAPGASTIAPDSRTGTPAPRGGYVAGGIINRDVDGLGPPREPRALRSWTGMQTQNRPISITIIAMVFIAVGSSALVAGAVLPLVDAVAGRGDALDRRDVVDLVLVAASELLVILGGA